ncbi:MAG: four helix bundle protein [Planctomycetota bacterium]
MSRRGSVSIAANIAEGCGRQTSAELKRFLHIAMGSASELECLLLLAHDLGLATPALANQVLEELTATKRQINTFIQRLESARNQQPKTNNQ